MRTEEAVFNENIVFFIVSGYAFLLFLEEISVQRLIEACIEQDQKLYLCVSSPTIKDKPVRFLYKFTLPLKQWLPDYSGE